MVTAILKIEEIVEDEKEQLRIESTKNQIFHMEGRHGERDLCICGTGSGL